tara:strand:+ start:358 stop:1440 length:1083 start_codon:yes stop_codon:yes gene_type:complete
MKTILVTGGAGFIGSALIRHLIKNTDFTIVNIDKLTYAGNLESLKEVNSNKKYTFKKIDICNSKEVLEVLNQYKPEIIMHLAAESHVDRSIVGPDDFIQSNIIGTYNLLECARKYWNSLEGEKKENFRFHHISTDEVYGDLPHPDYIAGDSNLQKFKESNAYAPSSPYSASKASSDHLVRAWNRTYGLPTIVTNCSNNYGPYHFPEKLIPLTILNALSGRPISIYGKGDQIRDWLYVEDHARALILVATSGTVSETYNIGGHNEKRNIDVVNDICNLLEELAQSKPQNVDKYSDLITFTDDRPGHDLRYAIDSKKIKKDLGWFPLETFESGLKKTVQWYLDNQIWCENIKNGTYMHNKNV